MNPTLRHRLEFALYTCLEIILVAMPWATVQEIGAWLGKLGWLLDARHRRVVRKNLRLLDPAMSEAQLRSMSIASFAQYGSIFTVAIRVLRSSPEEIRRWVRVEGLEHYQAAQAKGRGVIEFSGHYGNWEAASAIMGLENCPVHAIARPLGNPLLDAAIVAYREQHGCVVIPKGGAIREALRRLEEGHVVAFIMDQDALTAGIWVKFLGTWASTYATAASLAVRKGIPMLPCFVVSEPDGRICVRFDPALEPPNTGDLERDTWVATQLMTQCIERQVRRSPLGYFWLHNRFKTRPGEGNPLPAPLPDPAWAEALPADAR
jgi:KDO2-lipid IV(A) lauroyltransferase